LFLFKRPRAHCRTRAPPRGGVPRGAAVVARGLVPAALAGLVALARRRRLLVLVAGDGRAALRHRAGLHVPDRRHASGFLPSSSSPAAAGTAGGTGRPPLDRGGARAPGIARARRLRADAVVLSPVFPTPATPARRRSGALRRGRAGPAREAAHCRVALARPAQGTYARRLPAGTAGLARVRRLETP
jgi:thiamine-phosphate pyrophosphorylase